MELQFAWILRAPVARITRMNACLQSLTVIWTRESANSHTAVRSALIIHKLQFNTTREKWKIQSRFQGFLHVFTAPEELRLQMWKHESIIDDLFSFQTHVYRCATLLFEWVQWKRVEVEEDTEKLKATRNLSIGHCRVIPRVNKVSWGPNFRALFKTL